LDLDGQADIDLLLYSTKGGKAAVKITSLYRPKLNIPLLPPRSIKKAQETAQELTNNSIEKLEGETSNLGNLGNLGNSIGTPEINGSIINESAAIALPKKEEKSILPYLLLGMVMMIVTGLVLALRKQNKGKHL